jgi:PAS domain S-box-containing protein
VVPCYITVQDRDFRIVESNDLFRRDFGECDGQHCYRAYKSRDEICPGCVVEATLQDGQVHTRQEKVTTRDGKELDIVVTSMPIRDDDGSITGVMEMSTDITEVMSLQMELARMGHAVASMAHRMKNVLMGLEGGIFVTNEGFLISDQEVVQEGWDMVQRNVDKVSRIARDLLYCSKEREPRLEEGVSPESIARMSTTSLRLEPKPRVSTSSWRLATSLTTGPWTRMGWKACSPIWWVMPSTPAVLMKLRRRTATPSPSDAGSTTRAGLSSR